MAIEISLDKLAAHVGATLDQTARAIKISIFNGVIRDTRVDTGRLRGNWQTSNDQIKTQKIERLDPDGNAAMQEAEKTVKGSTVDYLTNNLEYAAHWEERDGMVAKNVARIDRNIREVLSK